MLSTVVERLGTKLPKLNCRKSARPRRRNSQKGRTTQTAQDPDCARPRLRKS